MKRLLAFLVLGLLALVWPGRLNAGYLYQAYLPVAVNAELADLAISGLEVTQAIQTVTNTVPLVAGRPAVARIYAGALTPASYEGIYMSLEGTRQGEPLPGSPIVTGPLSISGMPTRTLLSSSLNVPLPGAWLSGTVALTATLRTSGRLSDSDPADNVSNVLLDFVSVPPLDIKLVPINYTYTPTQKFFPANVPAPGDVSDWLLRTFPVSQVEVSFRDPVDFAGNLEQGDEWVRLLELVSDVRSADGAPLSQIYYALVPTTNSQGDHFPSTWAGLGWVGSRVSVGLSLGSAEAHEVGHNLGLLHAPCGSVSATDPGYPYPQASIGQVGLDVQQMRLWSPDAPDYAHDLMSYCRPAWLSDYSYARLFQDQCLRGEQSAQVAGARPSLLIRAVWDALGRPQLLPVYALPLAAEPVPASSEYAFELVGAEGEMLARQPVTLYEAAEEGVYARQVRAAVPAPGSPVDRVRLVRAGQVVAERALVSFRALDQIPIVQGDSLQWSGDGAPSLVRYTRDGGRTWTALGVDVRDGSLRLDPNRAGDAEFEVILGR